MRDGKTIIPAHDHGVEHGPTKFDDVRDRLAPETVFEMATHSAVTGFAVGRGLAVGRNVWQHEEPTAILDALEEVVFEGATAGEALSS